MGDELAKRMQVKKARDEGTVSQAIQFRGDLWQLAGEYGVPIGRLQAAPAFVAHHVPWIAAPLAPRIALPVVTKLSGRTKCRRRSILSMFHV
jgi:hypothetical protein